MKISLDSLIKLMGKNCHDLIPSNAIAEGVRDFYEEFKRGVDIAETLASFNSKKLADLAVQLDTDIEVRKHWEECSGHSYEDIVLMVNIVCLSRNIHPTN